MNIFDGADREFTQTQFTALDLNAMHVVDKEVNHVTIGGEKVTQTMERKIITCENFLIFSTKAAALCTKTQAPAVRVFPCEACRQQFCSVHVVILGQRQDKSNIVACHACYGQMQFERNLWTEIANQRKGCV